MCGLDVVLLWRGFFGCYKVGRTYQYGMIPSRHATFEARSVLSRTLRWLVLVESLGQGKLLLELPQAVV